MMAKRSAEDELTREHGFTSRDDDYEEARTASADVLKSRPMARPIRRLGQNAGAAPRALPANPFANLGSSGPSNAFGGLNSAEVPAAAANPFAGFGTKPAAPVAAPLIPKPAAAATFTAAKPFASTNAVPPTPAGPALSVAGADQLRLRALNSKFAETVAKYAIDSAYGDWTKLCEDYIKYHKSLGTSSAAAAAPSTTAAGAAPVTAAPAKSQTPEMEDVIDIDSESDSESEDDKPKKPVDPSITAGGFKFSGSAAGSAFSFGGKTFDHSASTSASTTSSEPKTGGFKPTFDINAPKTKLPFSSGAPPAAPAAPAEPAAEKPSFAFGKPAEKPVEKTESEKPKFTFGKPAEGFTFGKPVSKPEETKKDEPEAAEADAAETGKPKFTFGSNSSSTTPFSFGNGAKANFGEKAIEDGPAKAASETSTGFTFGKPEEKKDDKPKFTFGQSSETPKFTFGKPSEPAKFTFGANKPGFSFGAKSDADKSTEKAIADESESGDKPKFAFGSTSWQPGQAIKFDQPINVGSSDSKPESSESKPEAGEGEGEETGDGSFHDLSGKGRGEEDEDAVYERRAKVYELKNGKYDSVGVGSLRVLVHKDTKKARLLIRADGSGRVLVNVGLHKQLTYTLEAPGQVKVVDFQGPDKPPVTYLVQVNKANGDELKDKLEEVKN